MPAAVLVQSQGFPFSVKIRARDLFAKNKKKITHAQAGIIQDMKQWKDWGGGKNPNVPAPWSRFAELWQSL